MNKLENGDITLDVQNHEYKLKTNSDISFTSVTTFINSFFEPFDDIKISNHLVNNVPKYFGRTPESLIEDWNVARKYGTEVHLEIENWIKNGTEPKDSRAVFAKSWIGGYVNKPHIKTLSEVIVFSEELGIAGTIDILMMNQDSNEYVLIDWKTSKRIDMKSFKGKMGIKKETKKIEDCNYNHYALQLSLYRYILETYYGININRQIIAHLKEDGVQTYSTPYMKNEIKNMLVNAEL